MKHQQLKIIIFLILFGILINNIANAQHGSGVYIEGAGKLTNCIITNGKQFSNNGSAIAISGEGALVANCLVAKHTCVANDVPTAILQLSGSSTVVNSSFIHNESKDWQPPCISGNITLVNCLVWGNRKVDDGNAILLIDVTSASYCASDDAAPYAGVGNIALSSNNTGDANSPYLTDPVYSGQVLGDYHVDAGSACIGAGNTALLPAGLATDMDGKPRKYGDFVDMGCYQSYSPIWLSGKTVTYTGLPQGVDAAQFFDTNGGSMSQPGGTTVTYTYYQNGTALGAGVVPTDAGTYEAVATLSGGTSGTSNRATLTISKAPLTVMAKNKTIVYGVLPTASELADWYDISGFVNGETESVLTTKPTVTLSPDITATTPPGIYPGKILISGGAAANYSFTYNYGTLTIAAQPTVITSQPTGSSICNGTDYTFQVKATGTELSYQWYKGNNPVSGANSNTLRIDNATKSDYDTYYVKVSNTANTVISNRVRLWVADPLPAILSFASYPSPATTSNSYLVKLNGYADVSKYSWSYSKPGVTFQKSETTSNETTVAFSTEAIGKGTISVEMEHVCGNRVATQEIEVKYPTGIDNIAGGSMKAYPNPVKEQLTIENDHSLINKVVVMDMNGKILHRAQPNAASYQLPVANYPKGIYFVKIATEAGETVRKIVKN